jgi:hypothetical protein
MCKRERDGEQEKGYIVVPSVGIGETTLVHTTVRRKRIKSIKSKEARFKCFRCIYLLWRSLLFVHDGVQPGLITYVLLYSMAELAGVLSAVFTNSEIEIFGADLFIPSPATPSTAVDEVTSL